MRLEERRIWVLFTSPRLGLLAAQHYIGTQAGAARLDLALSDGGWCSHLERYTA